MENLLKNLDKAQRDALITDVRNKFILSRDFYAEKHALFKRLYKEYRAQRDDSDVSDWSIKIALAYGLVENIVSRISQTVLGKLTIEVKPKRDDQLHKADNFYNMCRTYFGSPEYRIDYTNATRERVICGTAWEFDEWASEYEDGFRWAVGKMEKVAQMDIPVVSTAAKIARKIFFKGYQLVSHKFPVKVGYKTRFPSIFSVFPQPGIVRVEDLAWVVEEVGYKTVDELRKATYIDEEGNQAPVFDLSEIDALIKRGISVKPSFPDDNKSIEAFRNELEGVPQEQAREKNDGVPAVHLLILRTLRGRTIIANGSIVIQHVKDLFHKPGLKIRARYYTPSNHSIYGMGAIEPILDSLNEFSDIHSLAMQDWFRSVNQMIAYSEDAFPYPEDFDSRAGGLIRAASGVDLQRAIMPVAKQDKIGSMITAQSGVQGIIENIVSVAEMTPGVMGTRPFHTTYGGLMEVQQTMARRFAIMMNIDQCETMKQMEEMYWLYEQFMFDPMPFKKFSGGIGAISYKREDIDTDGEGFLYVASDDPSFGDSQVQRNQALVLLQQSLNYAREQKNNPEWDKANCGEYMRMVNDAFGKGDSDKLLTPPDGSMDPDKELELMLQGVDVQTHPKENKTQHLIKHALQVEMQKSNPEADPQVLVRLINHIDQTRNDILALTDDPQGYSRQFMQEEALKRATPAAPGFPLQLGQDLPSNMGAQTGMGGMNA